MTTEERETEVGQALLSGRNPVTGRFEKGFSGNPSGRPKERWSLLEAVERRLEAQPELKDGIVDRLIEAAGRDPSVTKQLWDRLDGTVTERSETLLKRAEADEMDEEAILIAAQRITERRTGLIEAINAVEPCPDRGS